MPEPGERRRKFLLIGCRWVAFFTLASFAHPLLRFTGFSLKDKPRQVLIDKPLPTGGYHITPEFILFNHEDGVKAVSRTCTHLGCRLNFRPEADLLECPCHQSRFTRQGMRIAGPAKDDLPHYPVETLRDAAGVISGYRVTL